MYLTQQCDSTNSATTLPEISQFDVECPLNHTSTIFTCSCFSIIPRLFSVFFSVVCFVILSFFIALLHVL